MPRDFMQRRRIDARTADARDLRLNHVHRGLGGEITAGRDVLSGESVTVPKLAADPLQPAMGSGMGWLKRNAARKASVAAAPGAMMAAGNAISSAAASLVGGTPTVLPGPGARGVVGSAGTERPKGLAAVSSRGALLDEKLAADPVAAPILARNARMRQGVGPPLRDAQGNVQNAQALNDVPSAGVVPHGFIGAAARARVGTGSAGRGGPVGPMGPVSSGQLAVGSAPAGAPVVNEGVGKPVITRMPDFRKRMARTQTAAASY